MVYFILPFTTLYVGENMKRKNILFLTVLIIVLIVLGCIAKPDIPTIFNGVVTSVIASFLFLIFTMLVDNSSDEIKNKIEEVNEKLSAQNVRIDTGLSNLTDLGTIIENADSKVSIVSEYIETAPNNLRKKLGIIRIEPRKEYSYDFWATFLNDALIKKSKKFIISGKTLHRWLEAEIRDDFRKALLEMISQRVKINFVVYSKPTSTQKKEDLRVFLCKEIFPHLVHICGRDLNDINKVFGIYEVNSLSYLYTAIDSQVVVAHYFNNTSNSENIMLVLSPECAFAHRYQEDFNSIQKRINNSWIKAYLQREKGTRK